MGLSLRALCRSGALALALLLSAALAAAAPRSPLRERPPEPTGPGPGPAGTARADERGFPLLQTYVPSLTEASSQSFGIAADPRGVLYVANLNGVLVYDGAWWRLIPVGQATTAFSLAADAAGRVAVGGADELGYLAPDGRGSLQFVSLLGQVPPAQRQMGQVLQVFPTRSGFGFVTSRWLFLWDGTRLVTAATFPGDRPLAKGFDVSPRDAKGAEACLWTRAGIVRLDGERLVPVAGGETFRDRRVDLILPADGGLLVSVRGEGLFLLRAGRVTPFAPAASRWTAEKRLFEGRRLADGRWALGSILGGLLLLRPDGEIDQIIDSSVDLPDDFVTGVAADREGSLWLALNSGIVRIEVASPLSVVDSRSGLKGSVYQVARHDGRLWAATAAGIFAATDGGMGSLHMQPVAGLPSAGWGLLSTREGMLAATAFGVYQASGPLAGLTVREIAGTEQRTAYLLAASRADPDLVWVGMEDGLGILRREGTAWRYAGRIAAVRDEVRGIAEGADGVAWCSTPKDGIVGVELVPPAAGTAPASPRVRRLRQVPASAGAVAFRLGGRILAARDGQVLRLDEERGLLAPAPLLDLGDRSAFNDLAEDAEGNLWLNSSPPAVALRQGNGWSPRVRSLVEVPARGIEVMLAEPDGVVWLATESGLFRYAGSIRRASATLPAPLLSRVTAGGALVFGGAPGGVPNSSNAPGLAPGAGRRLRIEFAPLSSRPGLSYQTRLEPVDADWNAAAEPFAELTRLPAGSYTFRVRTLGPRGERSPETAWSFRLLPPWYARSWALALWVAAGLAAAAAGLRAYASLRHRALVLRAAHLEARVAEQTVELRQTVDELRRTQAGLEAANVRLEELSLQDELTAIANRRCLQQVLEGEWSRARRHALPLGFILLDLDFFKHLNDTRGHREGDLCLQAVAGYLAATLRRSGDLVARYGGEEFAVLLPATDLAGTVRVAEQLRQGIAALGLVHEGVSDGRITASFGCAAFSPGPEQPLEELIEAADSALYRAKTEGRNRVRAWGESPETKVALEQDQVRPLAH